MRYWRRGAWYIGILIVVGAMPGTGVIAQTPTGGAGGQGEGAARLVQAAIAMHAQPSTEAMRRNTPLLPDPNRMVRFVRPQDTDPAIDQFLLDHYVITRTDVPQNGGLFVFFPGTFGSPHAYQFILDEAARRGYRAIGLEYPDDTDDPTASAVESICARDPDPACAGNVRGERLTGEDLSDKLTVSPANSIENRLHKLLAYLAQQEPDAGWDAYLPGGQIDWSHIAVGGHSQGAGVAAFIGKRYVVDRVAMWSGPSDYSPAIRDYAAWIYAPSATPVERYYGLAHQKEPAERVIVGALSALGLDPFGAPTVAELTAPIPDTHQLLVDLPLRLNNAPAIGYHLSTAVDTSTPLQRDGTPAYLRMWDALIG